MDNLSHSVAGLATGELIHRCLPNETDPEKRGTQRRLILAVCTVASNFPDLDLVLTPLLPSPLGYLLHHRGHTHTILYAFPQALLLGALFWICWPAARRLLKTSAPARKGFGLSLLVGFSLHLLMDYLNSYGIHPFHPIDRRWFYGDMIFILEPVFWIVFGMPMAMTARRRWPRIAFGATLMGLPLFFFATGFLSWTSALALLAIGVLLSLRQQAAGDRGLGALVLSAMIALSFVGLQSFASGRARHAIIAYLEESDPSSHVLDIAATPLPSNPVCWMFSSIEQNEAASTYRLRRGFLTLAPRALGLGDCPESFIKPLAGKDMTKNVAIFAEFVGETKRVRDLRQQSCHFEAWLRFARMPMVTETDATDDRFNRDGAIANFTRMDFGEIAKSDCPTGVPSWEFPRADLLGE